MIVQRILDRRFIPGGPGSAHPDLENLVLWQQLKDGLVVEVSETLGQFLLERELVKVATKADKVASAEAKVKPVKDDSEN